MSEKNSQSERGGPFFMDPLQAKYVAEKATVWGVTTKEALTRIVQLAAQGEAQRIADTSRHMRPEEAMLPSAGIATATPAYADHFREPA